MAATGELPERINEELLSCTICFGLFSSGDKLPKLLACSHTFCLQCIQEYLNSQGRNTKAKFPCPMCRTENQLSKGGVKDLPNNLTVLGLLDLVKEDTKDVISNENSTDISMQTGVSTTSGPPTLYPVLPQNIEPYTPNSTTNTQGTVELPLIEADPNKCYECSKPNPKVTLKCGHSICKGCKKKRHITNVNQSMCPLCIDLQAASMLLADSNTQVMRNRAHSYPDTSSQLVSNTATCPKEDFNNLSTSPKEAARPPAFNPWYSTEPSAPSTNLPTRVAPQPPPRSVKPPEGLQHYLTLENGGASPRDTGSPPPPPPPRRLPGEIIGSPLKCLKKIGSYSDVRMQTNTFKGPTRVSMYENGNFLVVDQDYMTVQVFNKRGEYISLFKAMGVQGACFYTSDKIAVATHRGIDIYGINGAPSGENAVGVVKNLVTYKFGFIAICDTSLAFYSQSLQVYKEIKKKVRPGVFQRSSVFEQIKDVAVTSNNDIAVLDSKAGEIYVINEDGLIKLVYTPATETCGPLKDPYAITIDRYNNLYVADTGNKRVLKFYANGKFARCVLNFAMGNPTQAQVKTSVYGLSSGDAKHLVMAIHGDKTAEVRLYDV